MLIRTLLMAGCQHHALAHAGGVGNVALGGASKQQVVIQQLLIGEDAVARALLEVLAKRREPIQRAPSARDVAHVQTRHELDLHRAEPPRVARTLEADGLEAAQGAGAIELKVVAVRELDGNGVRGAAEAVALGERIERRAITGGVAVLADDLGERPVNNFTLRRRVTKAATSVRARATR